MSRDIIVTDLIKSDTKQLKMPGLARAFEDLSRHAQKEHWSHEDYLHESLQSEIASRIESTVRLRMRQAEFPELKTLEQFDFSFAEGLQAASITALARCDFIPKGDHLLFVGPIGTGKSHIATSIGVAAARLRYRVRFFCAADLVCKLVEERDKKSLGRFMKRLTTVDLLLLDELGFVPFDRQGGELLFNILTSRHRHGRSVIVTSNLAFSEWPKVLGGDVKLTSALLDRLAERATVIVTKGKSYRKRKQTLESSGTKQ